MVNYTSHFLFIVFTFFISNACAYNQMCEVHDNAERSSAYSDEPACMYESPDYFDSVFFGVLTGMVAGFADHAYKSGEKDLMVHGWLLLWGLRLLYVECAYPSSKYHKEQKMMAHYAGITAAWASWVATHIVIMKSK